MLAERATGRILQVCPSQLAHGIDRGTREPRAAAVRTSDSAWHWESKLAGGAPLPVAEEVLRLETADALVVERASNRWRIVSPIAPQAIIDSVAQLAPGSACNRS